MTYTPSTTSPAERLSWRGWQWRMRAWFLGACYVAGILVILFG